MVKIWQSEKTIDHPWDRVSYASWRKYPNPKSPHVSNVETVNREVGPDGTLRSTRLFQCVGIFPSFLNRFLGHRADVSFVEDSEVNPAIRRMKLTSVNLSIRSIVRLTETCVYEPSEEDPDGKTSFHHELRVEANLFGLGSKIESICVGTFAENAGKGLKLLNGLCDTIARESQGLGIGMADTA